MPAGHRGLFWKNRWLQWLLKIASRGFHWLTPQGAGWNLVSDPVGFLNASAQGSVMMSKEPDVRISVPRIRLWARGCGGQERGVLSGRGRAGAPRRSRGKRACARGSPRTRRLWGRGGVSAGGRCPPYPAPRPGGQRASLRLLPSGPKLESSLGGTRGTCGDSQAAFAFGATADPAPRGLGCGHAHGACLEPRSMAGGSVRAPEGCP